jgi:MFS family permease
MITFVAVPYEVYQLTKSSLIVGLLGSVQLVPLLFTSLYGGSLADSMNRRKILVVSEIVLILAILGLALNSRLEQPSYILIFVLSAITSAVTGFHRPALTALTPQIVPQEDLPAIAALGAFQYSIGAIAGPALAGWVISQYGLSVAYFLDVGTFAFALFALIKMKNIPAFEKGAEAGLSSVVEGLRYAKSRADLMGTYFVDIIAMLFAMPMALYPAMAEAWGGASSAGWLYAAMPLGAMITSFLSRYADRISRYGAAIILSAIVWGIGISALAFAEDLGLAVICLAIAGFGDGISAIYRQTIWNSTIPTHFRGRLAGVEMLSYMSGPLLGNARAGFMATAWSPFVSIFGGGILCIVFCAVCVWVFPTLWNYRAATREPSLRQAS